MSKVASVFQSKDTSPTEQALSDLKQSESYWLQMQPVINREINNAQYQHLRSLVEDIQAEGTLLCSQMSAMYRSVTSDQRLRVLNWISPVKYEDAHRQKKRQAMQHTADWLLEHQDYLAWVKTGSGGALWLSGYMGSGKSCLVHAVVEELAAQLGGPSASNFKLAYYYCDGSDASKKAEMASAERILCVLVKQLAAADPDTQLSTDLLNLYEQRSHESNGLSEKKCLDLLVSMSASLTEIRIVIDGLDECEAEVQSDFLKSLQYLTQQLKHKCKIFIACRPHLNDMLRKMMTWTISVPEHNREAIELMIRTSVDEAVRSPRLEQLYCRESERLDEQVIDVLISDAGGMYRWVDMALTFLHQPPVDTWEIKARLQSLPRLKNLYQLYDHMWESNMQSLSKDSRKVVEAVMLFLIYGLRYSLDGFCGEEEDHILEACTFLRSGKLGIGYTVSELLTLCPGFLTCPEDEMIGLPHVSVRDWLLTSRAQTFGPMTGHTRLAELCIRVLTEVESTSYSPHNSNGLMLYASVAWPAHLRSLKRISKDLRQLGSLSTRLDTFLAGSPPPAPFLRWHDWVNKAPFCDFIPNWDESLHDYGPIVEALYESHPPSNAFACLYVDYCWNSIPRNEHAVARKLKTPPWCSHLGDNLEVTSMAFATVVGNANAVHWLASHGLSPNDRNSIGWTVGHQYLFLSGLFESREPADPEGLEILVQEGLDLHARDEVGQTCFAIAVGTYSLDWQLLKVFIDNSYDIFEPLNVRLWGPRPKFTDSFDLADEVESTGVIRRIDALEFALGPHALLHDPALALIPEYFKRYTDAASRARWLGLAAEYSRSLTVQTLIGHGAEPLARDHEGLLPLERALKSKADRPWVGDVLDVLAPLTLGHGVRVSITMGCTPLRPVISHCSMETVMRFVKHVANPVVEPSRWGSNLITFALEKNHSHGQGIALYLCILGYRE